MRIGKRLLRLGLFWVLTVSPLWGGDTPLPSPGMITDHLSPAEEELAYSAKSPAERVEVLLRIADRRVEATRKALRTNPSANVEASLKGYMSALDGAQMAVSWGQSLGMNMQRQLGAIGKTSRKHIIILGKLESTAASVQRSSLLRIKQALTDKLTSRDFDLAVGATKLQEPLSEK